MAEREASISEAEWALLEALWEAEQATASELADVLKASRGWARTTVKTMLDRMAAKGLVSPRRVGNTVEYRPALAAAEARRSAWRRFVGAAFGGAMAPALEFIATDAKLTARQRKALRKLLEEDTHA
jgi:BlaI family penicillinase repressor